MLDQLLARVRQAGSSKHVNIVAYSGGVDSSLVAALVHRVFPENSIACLGVSAALPQDQLLLARNVASAIGIPLWEARTSEGNDPRYVENKGQSKTTPSTKQTTLDVFVVPKTIPSARSAHEAWCQWFYADVPGGRPCALKDFTKEMIKSDRKKYSERVTLSLAFMKFQTYELFESAYAGHTETYSSVLKEARQSKREKKL
ncbi:hypothetical protein DYB37_011832 [Aphanomyces astaci]|uniref:NAD/GMP synthase domain-containing protein n=1 Tax=Aphanomyces astaci TaxID=112090 RepID=A0A3R6WYC5_APHAT|nr:hypothetical protein DYB35_010543 [Aphanomyces astaci]RHZ19664.1 hypothetical protein DYB37_011832 [Aphanomyces astaci]